jgi:hypothetical protein
MENLVNRNSYPDGMALRIETMGSITVSIANRWMMGWPNLVKGLLRTGCYLDCLETQVAQEKDALADAVNLKHLSRSEILEMYGIREFSAFSGAVRSM